MATSAHESRSVPNDRTEIERIPPDRVNKKPQRKIFRSDPGYPSPYRDQLGTSFGPYYCEFDTSGTRKDDAWEHILKRSHEKAKSQEDNKAKKNEKSQEEEKSHEEEKEIVELYMSAMRRIEQIARATYADGALDSLTESQFRWMMIKDGCFFLQLALFILGSSEQLGYTNDHHTFGRKQNNKKNINEWIESMFFVGNQVPLVVLNELMKQSFFQNIIAVGKWKKPSNMLTKQLLYELLILPAREYRKKESSPTLKDLHGRESKTSSSGCWLKEQPSDVLHGLQCLVLGPKSSKTDSFEDEPGDGNLETRKRINADSEEIWNIGGPLCATELRKGGIRFKKLKGSNGSEGICCRSFLTFSFVYLPKLVVHDDTEMIFQNLKDYETCQREEGVTFYLFLMSCLITSYQDVNVLASSGIIEAASPYHKCKLLRMLRKLADPDISSQHYVLLLEIKDLPVSKFKSRNKLIALFGLYLTAVQTVIAFTSIFPKAPKT